MEDKIKNDEKKMKKKGRKPKGYKEEYVLNKDQSKFFVDLSKEDELLKKVQDLLIEVNDKNYGSEITFKDMALFALDKLTKKDIEKLKDNSLTEMEKVERSLEEYNKKNGTKLNLGEYLIKKLNIH